MEKPAENDHPIHDLIRRRWSPRAFSDRPVEGEILCSLFEAARWAPSCYNDQPWYFFVGTKDRERETYDNILDCLVEGNRTWAKGAPVLGLSVARLNFTHNDEPNRHAVHDVGLAAENLVLEALDRGLFVHQMAGFSGEKAREHFGIPKDHEPMAAIALGYPGSPEELPGELREREHSSRERRPLEGFVFGREWGEASDLIPPESSLRSDPDASDDVP